MSAGGDRRKTAIEHNGGYVISLLLHNFLLHYVKKRTCCPCLWRAVAEGVGTQRKQKESGVTGVFFCVPPGHASYCKGCSLSMAALSSSRCDCA